jgi:uncharacterized protein YaiL (DUF2058 family)
MAHSLSLRDQLLKAGLVTQEQVEQANQPKPSRPDKPTQTKSNAKAAPKPAKPHKKPAKPVQEASDLEKFYREREQLERNERQEQEKLARERAARKKEIREKVRALLEDKLQNREDADIRYNFAVGDNIKYLYVTTEQQQQLADGSLAITFLEGKRCLISAEVARQLQEIDPGKLIILNTQPGDTPVI